MSDLTAEAFVERVRAEFGTVAFPADARAARRPGVAWPRYERAIAELGRSLASLGEQNSQDADAYTTKALQAASLLFVLGAPLEEWTRWLALAGFGYAAGGDVQRARYCAIVAGEWAFLNWLPKTVFPEQPLDEQVVAKLAGCAVRLGAPDAASDEYDAACLVLAESIPASDHKRTERALGVLCDFWTEMAAYLAEPNPEMSPEFEPRLCALAALAYRNGYRPAGLAEECVRFLEPGLSGAQERAWFKRYFP